MTPEQPFTPIPPPDPSLAAHLAALDVLAARLSALSTRTRWSARVPLNSKASMVGHVVHTNELKVNIGGGYWVEMTAKEAEEYIQRCKTDLLLSHAGLRAKAPLTSRSIPRSESGLPTEAAFNPLFIMPAAAGPSKISAEVPTVTAPPPPETPAVKTQDSTPVTKPAPPTKVDRKGKGREISAPATAPSPSPAAATAAQPRTLQDLMDQFLAAQQSLSQESQENIAKLNGSQSADALVNEEGLPIHEIREDMDGTLIGEAPQPTLNGDVVVDRYEEDEDWNSEEARRRREEKKRLVFGDGDGEDDDEEVEAEEANKGDSAGIATPIIEIEQPEEHESPATEPPARSPSPPPRRPSSHTAPPRSILKQPTARKKSVSFDDTVPIPPDSPPNRNKKSGFGFPLPLHDFTTEGDEFEPRPVPILPVPKPAVKPAVGESFGGFKPGFLDKAHGDSAKPSANVTPTSPGVKMKKGPSLFAQRMAAQEHPKIEELPSEESPSAVVALKNPFNAAVKSGIVERTPVPAVAPEPNAPPKSQPKEGLPRLSEQKPMTTLKNAVVEKAPAIAQMPPKVQVDSPSSAATSNRVSSDGAVPDVVDESTADIDHDDEDVIDEDDEDEYDLDDALLAREVALEWHRRQAYMSMASRGVTGDEPEQTEGDVDPAEMAEYDEDDDDEELREVDDTDIGIGGVMMGLPQISADGQIINPTPDDIRKYIRVGRLENGNLVLAPGEEGWSDDEDEDKAQHRENLRRQLLGETPVQAEATSRSQDVPADIGLPPKVTTDSAMAVKTGSADVKGIKDIVERSAEKTAEPSSEGISAPEPAAPAKKVSRFKAGRMGK